MVSDRPQTQDFRRRQSQSVAKNKKRTRELDWEDTRRPAWVGWVSLLCILALLVAILALAGSDRISKPTNINGDQLGPYDLSREDYDRHSESLIAEMTGDGARWALVSPERSVNARELEGLFTGLDGLRVSTLLLGPIQWKLPEPAAGKTRADVFQQAVGIMSKGSGIRAEDIRFEGILVHGTPDELRELDRRPGVLAVEPAHPEAVYGRIGVRPLSPPEEENSAPESTLAPETAPAPVPAPEGGEEPAP